MNFGEALERLKKGEKLARNAWIGMFLYYVPANSYPARTQAAKGYFGESVNYQAYLAQKTTQEDVTPYSPLQADLLADDWNIVVHEYEKKANS